VCTLGIPPPSACLLGIEIPPAEFTRHPGKQTNEINPSTNTAIQKRERDKSIDSKRGLSDRKEANPNRDDDIAPLLLIEPDLLRYLEDWADDAREVSEFCE
jgi:hypothetical protein